VQPGKPPSELSDEEALFDGFADSGASYREMRRCSSPPAYDASHPDPYLMCNVQQETRKSEGRDADHELDAEVRAHFERIGCTAV